MKDRLPTVAGSFYPASPSELLDLINGFYAKSEIEVKPEVAALIVPHAGYVFSGEVAAAAFSTLDPKSGYENIFLVGTAHRCMFEGVSIYPSGRFVTPLGSVAVNEEIAHKLMLSNSFIYYESRAEQHEHTLEVQIPFLQRRLGRGFRIIPILIGAGDENISKKLAEALLPYFNRNNLFVFSSDFSHYPSARDASICDRTTADLIVRRDISALKAHCHGAKLNEIQNLSTLLCGESCVLTLIYLTGQGREYSYSKILYRHSGNSSHGHNNEVVGYWAICIQRRKREFEISAGDKRLLLYHARYAIHNALNYKGTEADHLLPAEKLNKPAAVFVSVYVHSELRGCHGYVEAKESLWQSVPELAVSAATRDLRFKSVSKSELDDLEIEISILSPLKRITDIRDIVPGKHGILIRKGDSSGTFLPQVALKRNWNVEEMLGYCSRDKAHLGWEGWKQADIFIYEASVFRG